MKKLREELGYTYIIRSARSLGPIDLLASNGKEVLAVQVKGGKRKQSLGPREMAELRRWATAFHAKPILCYKQKGRWWIQRL